MIERPPGQSEIQNTRQKNKNNPKKINICPGNDLNSKTESQRIHLGLYSIQILTTQMQRHKYRPVQVDENIINFTFGTAGMPNTFLKRGSLIN